MTEAQWLACADPTPMLHFVRGRASERKLRLFAVACCRQAWEWVALMPGHDREQRAIADRLILVAERYADREASETERAKAAE